MRRLLIFITLVVGLTAVPEAASAAVSAPETPGIGGAIERALGADGAGEEAPLSFSIQLLLLMSLLTILPGLVLMMTSFLRILVVLSILRQA
ncbi:MAG: flagellar biosynthetic protein FliP, partial [Pseudomonadota bacterium]